MQDVLGGLKYHRQLSSPEIKWNVHQLAEIKGYAPAVRVFQSNSTAMELLSTAWEACISARFSDDARGIGRIKISPLGIAPWQHLMDASDSWDQLLRRCGFCFLWEWGCDGVITVGVFGHFFSFFQFFSVFFSFIQLNNAFSRQRYFLGTDLLLGHI